MKPSARLALVSRVTVSQIERERAEREPPVEPVYIPPLAAELPIRQQMVILILRRGDLANRVLQELRMRYHPEPLRSDWAAVRDAGYTMQVPRKDGNGTKLALKPAAHHTAHELCQHYVRQFSIHHIERGNPLGNHGPWARCTCSWATFSSIRNAASVERYVGDHLRQVKDGTLPPAYVMKAGGST